MFSYMHRREIIRREIRYGPSTIDEINFLNSRRSFSPEELSMFTSDKPRPRSHFPVLEETQATKRYASMTTAEKLMVCGSIAVVTTAVTASVWNLCSAGAAISINLLSLRPRTSVILASGISASIAMLWNEISKYERKSVTLRDQALEAAQ